MRSLPIVTRIVRLSSGSTAADSLTLVANVTICVICPYFIQLSGFFTTVKFMDSAGWLPSSLTRPTEGFGAYSKLFLFLITFSYIDFGSLSPVHIPTVFSPPLAVLSVSQLGGIGLWIGLGRSVLSESYRAN